MSPRRFGGPRVLTDYTYKGLEAVFLENEHLRVQVLPGKGGDVLEFRDKRTDVNVLWRTDHNWQPPSERSVPSQGPNAAMDHYPGGWQVNLPIAGTEYEFEGNAYGIHGESALLPWDCTVVRDDPDGVAIRLETELVRYPFAVERTLSLPRGESRLDIEERITNRGAVELPYIWQQHVALGPPLLGPGSRLDIPAERGLVEAYGDAPSFRHARLDGDSEFAWPDAPAADGGTVDLTEFPPLDAEIHDQATAIDLRDGWYAVTNPDIDLGFGLRFPRDPFECVWYWQAFGGYEDSPFFGRNYTAGLEPTTGYPIGSAHIEEGGAGDMQTLGPGDTVAAEYTAVTYGGYESVSDVGADGTVEGDPLS
jgi:hypothetical protein